jgi:AcrR family transcriptional regulator
MGKGPNSPGGPGGAESATSEGGGRRPTARARTLKRRMQTAAAGPSKDRREIILEIAKRRFAEFGYRATTIREIAADAHILSGSIYHHFDTKDEILNNIITGTLKYMLHAARSISNAECDAEHKLVSLIRVTAGEIINDQHTHTIIWNERLILRREAQFAHMSAIRQSIYHVWRDVYADGSRAGLFHENFEPYLAIANIIRLLYSTAEWRASADDYTVEQVTNFHLQFILNAIRSPGRTGPPIPETICVDMNELAKVRAALVSTD